MSLSTPTKPAFPVVHPTADTTFRPVLPLVASAFLFGVFALLTLMVVTDRTAGFDNVILMAFRDGADNSLRGPIWVHEMVRDITALGSFALLGTIIVITSGALLLSGKRLEAAVIVATTLSGTLVSTVLKMAFNRPRPDLETMSHQFTASFPSGHALLSSVVFVTIGLILARLAPMQALKTFCIVVAALLTLIVGSTRLYMGVHFASDVLAGWCVGTAWALLCTTIGTWLAHRNTPLGVVA